MRALLGTIPLRREEIDRTPERRDALMRAYVASAAQVLKMRFRPRSRSNQ